MSVKPRTFLQLVWHYETQSARERCVPRTPARRRAAVP